MRMLPYYQVDAFTTSVFSGNPAVVCPLPSWLPDELMQKIALEQNMSETAFFVKTAVGKYDLRWFTPKAEVDLCGHATLASAFVLFNLLKESAPKLIFSTKSGLLFVEKKQDFLVMDFPMRMPTPVHPPLGLIDALGRQPVSVLFHTDYLVIYNSELDIRTLRPNQELLKQVAARAIIISAPGTQYDFVSRFFAPRVGVSEDPVTGSAHCVLAPYWAQKLKKSILRAKQLSERTGTLTCEVTHDRVLLSGQAVLFSQGEMHLPIEKI